MDSLRKLIDRNGRLWTAVLEIGDRLASGHTLCRRKPVGAILYDLRRKHIAMRAINGPLPRRNATPDHCTNEVGNCGCVHAEVLACAWLLQHPDVDSCVLLSTYSPCRHCANMILLSDRIVAVVYLYETENYGDGKDILARAGVLCVSIHETSISDPSSNGVHD